MTTAEMDKVFDILYDNISSNGAPGLNKYEKSVLLSKAQDELVSGNYSPFNTIQKGFEASENRRRELNELVTPYSVTTTVTGTDGIDANSVFFEIPTDVYYIIQEDIVLSSTDVCINNAVASVVPITHDEYNVQKKSPFRKPNAERAWRVDRTNINGTPVVEIISEYTPKEYKMRYIKQPSPIVLTDFESDPELTGLGLTVDGVNTTTECELNNEIHQEIVDRAVELAIRGYRENTLQANVELNKRNV